MLDDAISILLVLPFTYRGLVYKKIKYGISMDAQAKAKYKLTDTKERDPDEFPGRELGSCSQASQSSELLTCIQEIQVY